MKYIGPYISKYYNQFFNPNICHVCKSEDINNLTLCDRCYMISYCSERHKTIHQTQHKEICELIVRFATEKPWIVNTYGPVNLYRWGKAKKKFMKLIGQNLFRQLEPYEEQMFMSIKCCFTCYKLYGISVCKKCYSVNYCNEHAQNFRKNHGQFTCTQLTLSLNISIATMTDLPARLTHNFFKFVDNEVSNLYPDDTLLLIMNFLRTKKEERAIVKWTAADYVLSDYISEPLTLFYGVKSAELLHPLHAIDVFIVHIIVTNSLDKNYLPAWKLFLHGFPKIQKLVIIMIGLKLKPEYSYDELCEFSNSGTKILSFIFIPNLYHVYAASSKYMRPNVIVGYQIGFDQEKTWPKCIKAVQAQACPLFLTCSDGFLVHKCVREIQKILNTDTPHLELKNLFKSLAPHRDLWADDVYYRNTHIIIYKNLNN